MMSARKVTVIRGGWIVGFDGENHRIIKDGVVVVRGDVIEYVGKDWQGEAGREIDARQDLVMPGLINLDFADVRTVMMEMGKAMMGTGEAEGEERAIEAAEAAISNPLLDEVSMKGANGVLINITGGLDMTLHEVDLAANRIGEEVDPQANIIFGSIFDESLTGRIRVSVVATGIDAEQAVHL